MRIKKEEKNERTKEENNEKEGVILCFSILSPVAILLSCTAFRCSRVVLRFWRASRMSSILLLFSDFRI